MKFTPHQRHDPNGIPNFAAFVLIACGMDEYGVLVGKGWLIRLPISHEIRCHRKLHWSCWQGFKKAEMG